ncbi:Homocitrate synthase, mitochondrial [Cyphellophora attinorum]|uniref:Homocitrate synthase, mitochondrial n=1 Tax=Cyphellophora attinorum TaxID=1664694 RepID=A0A0N0NLW3_9EURO|nr:Homocitrate synthase, mitochondrial [Phialophora attinorum]KPI39648.1 Homocitrate synthase, mitochondrial [Phialophora attinorum]
MKPPVPITDFLSNVARFKIIDSTLREGEQFASAYFDTGKKIEIARALDEFGVDYIELTTPVASEQSRKDCEAICKLGLRAKILTHIRCHMDDARVAIETGVDGVSIFLGTSTLLQKHSHGKGMASVTATALKVISFVKSKGVEVRFSSEDSQAYDVVRTLRGVVSCDIEVHFHNDTGCAIGNTYTALEAGATHVDTSVLGIGERNGITPLGGFIGRMVSVAPDYVKSKYDLAKIKKLEDIVADATAVNIPFNNPITGFCAFTHKAGTYASSILAEPATYELINPKDFGMDSYVHFASRLAGGNAINSRAQQLDVTVSEEHVKVMTAAVVKLAAIRPVTIDDVDSIIHAHSRNKLIPS